ncbi:surface-adhesin E family protein [Chryseobacterium sp. Chry.R1]|uniref:surface-adhesin E family protein n=1 Tax=Chryseobacterium sp. Chry.R1 TaxID=3139392 RepID=UPI0031F86D24
MKRSLILLPLFIGANLFAQEWKYVTATDDGTIYHFKPNNDNTAWIKQTSNKIEYYPDNKVGSKKTTDGYKILLYKFDCSKKQLGMIQVTIYNKDGKYLNNFETKEFLVEMSYVVPDSVGENILNAMCNY